MSTSTTTTTATTREAFLAKIREAQPEPRPRPTVPLFDTPPGERLERFSTALGAMGGTIVQADSLGAVRAMIAGRFGPDAVVASAVGGIEGNRTLEPDMLPSSLQDVDVGVVRARFGVAETGSVWFSEAEYIVNSIGYLVQHLVVLLDPARIVDGLQERSQGA